jgi:hypothetical protein
MVLIQMPVVHVFLFFIFYFFCNNEYCNWELLAYQIFSICISCTEDLISTIDVLINLVYMYT